MQISSGEDSFKKPFTFSLPSLTALDTSTMERISAARGSFQFELLSNTNGRLHLGETMYSGTLLCYFQITFLQKLGVTTQFHSQGK